MRALLEERIARPELAAAPGRGASQTAFETALATEVAAARGQVAATSAIDMSKYFETVEVSEYVLPALRVGLPKSIVALASHFYLGPRRIRVKGAVSLELYPRRGIVAGCTWCTVLIRIMVLAPIDGLKRQLRMWSRTWAVNFLFRLYVDDGMITTYGARDNVALVHFWVSRYVMDWVRNILKKNVAIPKLQCISADGELRRTLRDTLGPLGYKICKVGELLGADYAAGGVLNRRRAQEQRRKKARARGRRLKWWASHGGNSAHVVDTGTNASIKYCKTVSGLPPPALRDMRRTRGAFARVRCGGASLTSKLALAGRRYCDADPAVLEVAPPLNCIAAMLWDFPGTRFAFVFAWRAAVRNIAEHSGNGWDKVNGPVAAAMCHLRQIGAKWTAPFRIQLEHDVQLDMLTLPPRQLYAVLQDRARVAIDRDLIRRLAVARAWDVDSVCRKYEDGIDWEYVRSVLLAPSLSAAARRALQVLTAGGFWSDERRWLNGYAPTPACATCNEAVGDDEHFFRGDCAAVKIALLWEQIASRPNALSDHFDDKALAPLTQMLLPPRVGRWKPVPEHPVEGWLDMQHDGQTYGDGSGYRQRDRVHRISTWAVVRPDAPGEGGQRLRGVVSGFFSTVPRAELSALREHLRHAPPNSIYVGDCQHVLDIVKKGVEPKHVSARSLSADLWSEVRFLLRDRGGEAAVRKIKAHRSRQAALDDGDDEQIWDGNQQADAHCKALARTLAAADMVAREQTRRRGTYKPVVDRLVLVMRWAFRQRQQFTRGAKKGGRKALDKVGTIGDEAPRHTIVEEANGRARCTVCRREAWAGASLARLRAAPCPGHVAAECHPTHELAVTRGVMWCTKCAAYTTRRPRTLRFHCGGKPASAAARNILTRLRQGQPPTTASYLDRASINRADDGPYGQRPAERTEAEEPAGRPSRSGHAQPSPSTRGSRENQMHEEDGNEGQRCVPCGPDPRGLAYHGRCSAGAGDGARHARDSFLSSRYRALDRRRNAGREEHMGAEVRSATPKAASDPPQDSSQRRRITGKQRVLSVEEAAEFEAAERRQLLCVPCPEAPWTQRLVLGATAVAAACRICGENCRGKCAGCNSPLCISCARKRNHCISHRHRLAAAAAETAHPHPRHHHPFMRRSAEPSAEPTRGEALMCSTSLGQGAAATACRSVVAEGIGGENRVDIAAPVAVLAPAACSASTVHQVLAVAVPAAAAASSDDCIGVSGSA